MTSRNSSAPRILLVEDQVLIAMCEEKALAKCGIETVAARSGEEALRVVGEDRAGFDAILLDIDLGKGMDGVAVAEELRRILPPTPIFFLSSAPESEVARKAGHLDDWLYLPKGFEGARLANKIFEALGPERRKPRAGEGEEAAGATVP